MAEIKSFRISDETKERLEALSESIGGNKDKVFNTLMDSYALEQQKQTLPDQQKSIETFEQYANTLVRLYLEALRAVTSSDDRIRGEFHRQLEEQAQTIRELREERDRQKKQNEKTLAALQTEKDARKQETGQLQEQIQSLKEAVSISKEQAAAKQSMNEVLSARITAAEKELEQAVEEKKRCEEIKKELLQAQTEKLTFERKLEEAIRSASELREKDAYEAQLRQKDAVAQTADTIRKEKEEELAEAQKAAQRLQSELQDAKTALISARLELTEKFQQESEQLRSGYEKKFSELQAELIRVYSEKSNIL